MSKQRLLQAYVCGAGFYYAFRGMCALINSV
jgi:hypothetical protein